MSLLSDRNLSDTTGKVVAEYICFGGSGTGLRSMGIVVIGPVSDPSMLPKLNFDGSIGNLAPGEDSGVILYPQAIFKDPFRSGESILVMCDAYTRAGWPIPANKRCEADKILSHPGVVAAKPSYTIVQVYTLSRSDVSVAGPQGPYHRGIVDEAVGSYIAASLHEACRHAGISIISNMAGVPGQWEFQVGPAMGISAGDKYWVARYILQRITEIAGIVLSFDPKPIQQGDRNGAGSRTNYSTESMRNDSGLEAIGKAIERIGLRAKEQIWAYYFTGCRETADINNFLWQGFASRAESIGRDIEEGGTGYLAYGGAASNMDPYVVTSLIAETTILWKPYYELALERAWRAVGRAWRAVVG